MRRLGQTLRKSLIGLTENISREAKIESALIAKGFSDAIAVIQEPSVLVIVHSEGFRQDEIARIADIVTKISQCRWEDVVIIPKISKIFLRIIFNSHLSMFVKS